MGRINRVQEGGAVDLSYTSLVYPASSEFIRGITSATIAILTLSGCITTQPDAVKVYINVPVPCVKKADLPKPPAIQTDADLAKLDDAKLILTIAAERLDLKQYASESGALLTACAE